MRNPRIDRMNAMLFAALFGALCAAASPAAAEPLKVFILAGQSNMQGWAGISTFDSLADDPQTAPILQEMRNADGSPRVCERVWISSVGCAGNDVTEQTGRVTAGFGASKDRIGPEFTFGLYLEKRLREPILLIKTSWGGKTLHTDFRPPGAGPYVFNDGQLAAFQREGKDLAAVKAAKEKETGVFYRLMIEHVRKVLADIERVVPGYDPKQGHELAGFVWFQGWNDFCDGAAYPNQGQPGGYDEYGRLLAQFIRDVRKDVNTPNMPFVIGVMGINGVKGDNQPPMSHFRAAQAIPSLLPEFKGNVVAVPTAPFWDDQLAALHGRWDAFIDTMNAEQKKHPDLTPEARQAARTQAMDEAFTPEEQKRLKGFSHWDCHYHGAAKIMAPIGKAFAEAMAELQKTR